MDEEIKEESKPTEDTRTGIQSATDERVEQLNANTERINQALAENENAKAREKLGGETEAGVETKPEFTDEQKASRARIKAVGDASGSAWAKDYE